MLLCLQLIPKAFYSNYLEGRQEGNTAELRSDASEITWKIKMDGRRLTKGWEQFAVAHNLQVGDILVFRHEGNLLFHVTPFGLSCCEILYSHKDEKDVKDKMGKLSSLLFFRVKDFTGFQLLKAEAIDAYLSSTYDSGKLTRNKTVKKIAKTECSLVDTDFVVPVTASNQRLDSFVISPLLYNSF